MNFEEASTIAAAKIIPSLPGFIGAIVSLRFFKADSWFERAAFVFSGWACAYFATQPVLTYFNVEQGRWADGTAFFIGLFGMAIVAGIMGAIKDNNWGAILADFVRKLIERWTK